MAQSYDASHVKDMTCIMALCHEKTSNRRFFSFFFLGYWVARKLEMCVQEIENESCDASCKVFNGFASKGQ